MKLKPAFPSSPSRPPLYSMTVEHRDREMMHCHSFGAEYSAKKLIEALIGEDDYEELSDKLIKTDKGIRIKSDDLIKIMNHKFTPEEKSWALPPPFPRMVQLFRGEKYDKETSDVPMNPNVKTKKPKEKTEKVEKKPSVPRPDGLISIQDLCAELKLEPSKARALLRKSNTPKPAHGWAWSKKEAEAIKKVLKS